MAQTPTENLERRDGHGIDHSGSQVIDPTKNVLDLVSAAIARQDDLRKASEKLNEFRITAMSDLQTTKTEALSMIQNWMRDTEMKRIGEKDTQRQFYETRIADMLRTSVESTSTLVSTQLVQIQNTFNERVAKLEQFRWESGGKTSVTDPALADALMRQANETSRLKTDVSEALVKMANSIGDLQTRGARGEGITRGGSETRLEHRQTLVALAAVVGLAFTVASFFVGYGLSHSQQPTSLAAPPASSALKQ